MSFFRFLFCSEKEEVFANPLEASLRVSARQLATLEGSFSTVPFIFREGVCEPLYFPLSLLIRFQICFNGVSEFMLET